MLDKNYIPGKIQLIKKLPVEKTINTSPSSKSKFNYIYKAIFLCFCGKEFIAHINSVNLKHKKSCGCWYKYTRGKTTLVHGESETRLHKLYCQIKNRCYNVNSTHYSRYGGRGIKMCKDWLNYITFRDWSLQNNYSDELSLDRIDPDGIYEPDNCRWATAKIQSINQKQRKPTRFGYPSGVIPWGKSWRAQITINKVRTKIGIFNTPEEASEAYQKAKKERDEQYYKEFNEQIKQNKNDKH